MKPLLLLPVLLLTIALPSFAAPESCERVKDEIQQKIIANGVPEDGFTLDIVPADQPDPPNIPVVGHCANDTFKIRYTRTGNDAQ